MPPVSIPRVVPIGVVRVMVRRSYRHPIFVTHGRAPLWTVERRRVPSPVIGVVIVVSRSVVITCIRWVAGIVRIVVSRATVWSGMVSTVIMLRLPLAKGRRGPVLVTAVIGLSLVIVVRVVIVAVVVVSVRM